MSPITSVFALSVHVHCGRATQSVSVVTRAFLTSSMLSASSFASMPRSSRRSLFCFSFSFSAAAFCFRRSFSVAAFCFSLFRSVFAFCFRLFVRRDILALRLSAFSESAGGSSAPPCPRAGMRRALARRRMARSVSLGMEMSFALWRGNDGNEVGRLSLEVCQGAA